MVNIQIYFSYINFYKIIKLNLWNKTDNIKIEKDGQSFKKKEVLSMNFLQLGNY
jgi:hypothetical protein